MVCIGKFRPSSCDDTAIELFEPLRSETERVFEELKCSSIPIIEDKEPQNEHAVVTESNSEMEHQNPNAQQVHLLQNLPTLVTIPLTSNPVTTTLTAPKVVVKIKNEPIRFEAKNKTDLTNLLFAFSNTDLICETGRVTGVADLWAPIRVKICAQREQIKNYLSCFEETQQQTQQKCLQKIEKPTTCGAIDAFNKNVDCVINTLNEVCPTEAQEIVVNIQEKLNDEAINHKCYQTVENLNGPVNDDGFRLEPVNLRCSAEQVLKIICYKKLH